MPYPVLDPLNWDSIEPHYRALLTAELTLQTASGWLQRWSDLASVLYEARAKINRAMSENTADDDADRRFNLFVEQIAPQVEVAEQALRDRLLSLPGYQPGADTVELMQRFRAQAAIFRDENVPLLTELAKLENRYDKIVGPLSIAWDGKQETLPQARLRWQSRDREERSRAWRLVMDAFGARRQELDDLFLEMLPLRRRLADNAGLSDFRAYKWLELGRFGYSPADCVAFHDAIEQAVVPLAREIYTQKAGKLGLDALRPWDNDVDPHGEPLRPFTEAGELEAGAQRIFEQVDPELAAYFAALRPGHLDLPSRANKAPGGYCESLPVTGLPYIFMNAVGTHDDLQTLLHEGGHAFHFMESRRNPLMWNHNGPMEFCEVASMGMELLAAPYLEARRGGFYSAADARRAYAEKLRDVVTFLPYMAVVDAFQHWIYVEAPEAVNARELDAKWSELWDRFMQGIDYAGLDSEKLTGWHRKLHIFQVPFYYVEYGLAELGALQIWRNALRDQARAVADYRAALALGNTRPLRELFDAAGARFAFDRQTVGSLMDLVGEQLARLTA